MKATVKAVTAANAMKEAARQRPPSGRKERPKTNVAPGAAVPSGIRIIDYYEPTDHVHTSQVTGTEVHLAKHRLTGEIVVLEAMDPTRVHPGIKNPRTPLAATTALHALLEHQHIARLHEVFDSERMVCVLEHVPGISLDEFMQNHGCAVGEAQQIVAVDAGRRLHARRWRVPPRPAPAQHHAQGRPPLLREARRLRLSRPEHEARDAAHAGGACVRGPELLAPNSGGAEGKTEYSGKAVDVWAMGVVMHVLLTELYPFTSEEAVREGKRETELPPECLGEGLEELLKGMLHVDRAERFSAADVSGHAWLKASRSAAGAGGVVGGKLIGIAGCVAASAQGGGRRG